MRSPRLILLFLCAILTARGAVMINYDPFTDGSRTNATGGDASGLVYYQGQTTSALTVTSDAAGIGTGNALLFNPNPGAGFGKFLAYFGPVTLTNVGDSITLTFNYRFLVAPTNISAGLRVGLYNTMGTRQTNDASDTTILGPGDRSDDVGYGFQSNPGSASATATTVFTEQSGNDILGGASPSQTANTGTAGPSVNSGTDVHFALLQIALQPNGNLALTAYIDGGTAAYSSIPAASVFTNTFDEVGWEEGGTSFAVPLLIDNITLVTTAASDFDSLRQNWVKVQTGGTNYNLTDSLIKSRVTTITNNAWSNWKSMDKTGTNTFLWSDLTSTTDSGELSLAYQRLNLMALGYATYGSSLRSNATLAADIQTGLNWMTAHRYNDTIPANSSGEYDNWFDWEIGAPLQIVDLCTYMYDALGITGLSNTLNAVDHFVPSPFSGTSGTSTGGNLTDKIRSVAVRGALAKDASKLVLAANAFSSLFSYVTNGDGFYADGSYIQHVHHAYTCSYGLVTIQDLSLVLPWLTGACWQYTTNTGQTNVIVPWRCNDPDFTNVMQWILGTYQPVIYNGAAMDMTRGRAVSRSSNEDHVAGDTILESILTLAASAFPSTNDAHQMRSLVKYMAQVDTFRNLTNSVPLPLVTAAEQLMVDATVPPRGELLGHWTLAGMDRVVHLRPGWGLGLSMSSSRVYNYESINNENLHGWFQGDGMTYFYTSNDLAQFSSGFWPTVDPYALPGTTVDTATLASSAGQSTLTGKNWVGGATLGNNGIAGMDLDAVSAPLVAKKSWFMFNDEVVCLGAGITDTSSSNVQTIALDRKLATSNTNGFTVNGVAMSTTLGWSTNFATATSCWLAGFGGCYFPGAPSVKASRSARTNSWSDINAGGSASSVVNNYLKLWFDHGVKPASSTYAYVLLPNSSSTQVTTYAASPTATVLENTTNAQAVKETALNLVGANFWRDAVKTVDLITVNRKAAVLTQSTNGVLTVAVSDPTQTNTTGISVTLNTGAYGVLSADPAINVTQLQPVIQMTVNTANTSGGSLLVSFATTNAPPFFTVPYPGVAIDPGARFSLDLSTITSDPDLPWQTLSYSLAAGPTNASLDTNSGLLTWTPTVAQAGALRSFSVVVSDSGTPSLSATQSFNVLVYKIPTFIPATFSNGAFTFGVSADLTSTYIVKASTDLVTWLPLVTNQQFVNPFLWTDPSSTNFPARFYRIQLSP